MRSRAMALEELGRALQRAFRINRQQAEAWAAAIIAGNTEAAVRELITAYMRGRVVGYQVHGRMLGAPASLPVAVAVAWRETARTYATGLTMRAMRTFDERGDITRVFVRSYANELTRQTTWAGQDDTFKDLGRAFDVEFKRWVRAWPRTVHRDHHDDLEDVVIPVDDLFTLPGGDNTGAQVYGPRDWDRVGDPGEWMNCGHALAFETRPSASDMEAARDRTVYDPRNQPRTR
jgi:hypothetical protein